MNWLNTLFVAALLLATGAAAQAGDHSTFGTVKDRCEGFFTALRLSRVERRLVADYRELLALNAVNLDSYIWEIEAGGGRFSRVDSGLVTWLTMRQPRLGASEARRFDAFIRQFHLLGAHREYAALYTALRRAADQHLGLSPGTGAVTRKSPQADPVPDHP